MVKIQQLPSGQLIITIPKKLAEYEGLGKGMNVYFKKHQKGFVLEVKKEAAEKSESFSGSPFSGKKER